MTSDGFPYPVNEPGNFSAEQPTNEQLLEFGYAPGSYDAKCRTCRGIVHDVDKRALRCRGCAVNAFRAAAARPVAAVVNGPEHRPGSALTRSHLRIYRHIADGTLGSFMAPADVRSLLDEIDRQEIENALLLEAVKRSHQATDSLERWLAEKDPDLVLPLALGLMLIDSRQKREAALTHPEGRVR